MANFAQRLEDYFLRRIMKDYSQDRHIIYMMRKKILACIGLAAATLACGTPAMAENLVILHTNDTHSQIDPDDKDNLGGIARRKVITDSVRAAEPNVMLIDAGDAVQGTLYFNLYGGEMEQKAMNALNYDLRILGNHEFDNGIDSLAAVLKHADSKFIATNYDFSRTPLKDKFYKYDIRRFGNRRIGFIAINLAPKGMISEGNYNGLEYLDAAEAANSAAWWLKNVDSCDMVVAITHIGYDPSVPPGDRNLAKLSSDIDVIIGGHSHDLIDPESGKFQWKVPNRNGKDVLVAQVGKSGKNIGQITIDLDDLSTKYKLIRVDRRLDTRTDPAIAELIAPYRAGVDSLMHVPAGTTAKELPQTSAALLNWTTDIVYERGAELADGVDFAILNKGGLRRGLPKGTITEGQVITMMPFDNHINVIDLSGRDLLAAFRQMAAVGGNGVSSQVRVLFERDDNDGETDNDDDVIELKSVTIGGTPLDPDRTYRVATIDYLANGGDYMPSLANHKFVAKSDNVLYKDVLGHIRSLKGKDRRINPSDEIRFKETNN